MVVLQHCQQVRNLSYHNTKGSSQLTHSGSHVDRGFLVDSGCCGDSSRAPEIGWINVYKTSATTCIYDKYCNVPKFWDT